MWESDYQTLSNKDREQFARIINLLLEKTFLLRDEVSSASGHLTINRDYRFLERHRAMFRNYLRVAGWEIQVDDQLGVAALYNYLGHNRRRINKNATRFLYVLRLIYEEQLEQLSLRKQAMITVGDLLEKMYHLGLWQKKPAEQTLRDAFGLLRGINVLDKLEGSWIAMDTQLVIYPSITLLVTNDKIEDLFGRITAEDSGWEGEEDENEAAAEVTPG